MWSLRGRALSSVALLSATTLTSAARLPVRADFASCLAADDVNVLTSSSSAWDTAVTPYNLRLEDQYVPSAIVYPSSPSKISSALLCASQSGLSVSPLAGGHSYSASGYGSTNGTLVISLSNLTSLSVDSSSGLAYVQTGLRLGDVAQGLFNNGERALAHGTCPYVGVGGHTSFGGYGFTSRKYGLAMDQVVEAEIVLANGTIVNASANENADLFWAVRGAAPSFGIVTQWTFQTHAAPLTSVGFTYSYKTPDADSFSRVLTAYTNWATTSAPAEIGLEATIGSGTVSIVGLYEGSQDSFNGVIGSLLDSMGTPDSSDVKEYGWIEALEWLGGADTISTAAAPDTHDTFLAKSLVTPMSAPLTAETYTAWANYLLSASTSSLSWFLQVELYGGANSAIMNVSSDATAFPFRDSLFVMQLYASSANAQPPYPYDDGYNFLKGVVDTIEGSMPGADFGAYTNYIDPTLENWQDLYYKGNYDRLVELQKVYDPSNIFMKHQSIGSA
ncbi:FAD-binding domain-containing protein [Stereum hirsutum FP-91666 SS1]|uniref:FAD-binding domain-containing protein n=1 Tax=Stereum hirsutum (strain FP-91666) TaxID=721885 RepID=UPI000440CCCE|nr:FAD-binding domain-containing protein [Stereum hirsutum FP-91666 SS1]EIM87014.1 FAD-binding domain-containing protein [Stereum hirsutum FP-91666 SS1]